MYLFYGNKTSVQFQNFSPSVVHPGDLQTHILWHGPLASGLPALLATGKERDPGPDSRPAFLLENLNNTFSDSVICGTVVASFP